jgi:hypothetical protein
LPASAGPVCLPAALFKAQIDQGLPWLDANTSGRFLPQMLALPEFGALSLRKGCFPGQEIVARTHYLGRSKRRLVWAHLEGATQALPSGCELALAGSDNACASLLASNWPHDAQCLLVINDAVAVGTALHALDHREAGSFVIDRDVSDNKRDASLNEGAFTPVGA